MLSNPLLSTIEIADTGAREQRCDPRKKHCVDIRYSVFEPAWTVDFFTVGDQARVTVCETPHRQRGERAVGLNVPDAGEPGRPALGYYVLAFKQREAARAVHRVLADASPACGGNYDGAGAWVGALGNAIRRYPDIDWQSIHFRRRGNDVATFGEVSR